MVAHVLPFCFSALFLFLSLGNISNFFAGSIRHVSQCSIHFLSHLLDILAEDFQLMEPTLLPEPEMLVHQFTSFNTEYSK